MTYRTKEFVLWLLLLVIVAFALYSIAQPLPPKVYRPARGVTQGAGAALLLAPKLVSPPGRTNLGIAWRYHTNDPAIVFNVRSVKTNTFVNPSLSWPVVAVVTTWQYWTPIDKRATCCWFSVTATNIQNGLESEFATR